MAKCFKRVDKTGPKYDGFMYDSQSGIPEYVILGAGCVVIEDSCGEKVTVYKEDIPNLMKALQAAYDYKEE